MKKSAFEHRDFNNRLTKFTEEDFNNDPKYFVCSMHGGVCKNY